VVSHCFLLLSLKVAAQDSISRCPRASSAISGHGETKRPFNHLKSTSPPSQVRAPASVPFPSRSQSTRTFPLRLCRAGKKLQVPLLPIWATGSFRFILHLQPETETLHARACCPSLACHKPFRPRAHSQLDTLKHISPRCHPRRTRALEPEMLTRVLLHSPRNYELLNPELKTKSQHQSQSPDQRPSRSQLLRTLVLPLRRQRSVVPCPSRLRLRPRRA
jgi:hypothetical protein